MGIGGMVFLGDDILPALSAHFRDFYSKPLRFRTTLPDFHLSSLSVSCAIALELPFQHQEIKNAVWALGSGKAPDIDGFPIEFFCTFWEVCSADVFAFCDEFAYSSVFLKELNQATCVLVPKRPNPTDVTHFRPISILGTPYKIIAKLLSLRLAPVMPSVINPFQVTFVKGRLLQDAVVLANEVVHSLYFLRLPSFILKLDISKAFDSVSWEFLSDLLTRFAFGPSFRQWIMSLVTEAQLAVSFNGKCGDFFCLERGLRQGCPLSPLLFNMVAESFSALFHHATVVGFLTPHSLSHLPSFSTLQYADDFLLFGSASRQQVVRTWLILRVFEQFRVFLSIPPSVTFPSFTRIRPRYFSRKLALGGKLLSLPGRITLAKHCLASVPLHALSVFRSPVAVLGRLDKLIRKFIWDGDRPSDRLAHWDVVAFPCLLGGAGVTNLSRACESSLCSWWWRLATEHSPITQFISSKFDLPLPSVWHSSISHTSPSYFWSDMLSVLPLFLRLADLPSSTSPSWPLSPTCEFTFSSCYLASFGPSVASLPSRSLWSPGPSPRAIAFAWLLLTGHINTFDHLQRLGISLANQCLLCLVATESRVHLFTSCTFFSSVLASTWPSLVSSLPNPPSIRLLFLFCPSPHLTASWDHVWRPWLISAWWRIWAERNNRVFRGTFSSPDSVARLVQGDVQFAIRLKRRCQSAVGKVSLGPIGPARLSPPPALHPHSPSPDDLHPRSPSPGDLHTHSPGQASDMVDPARKVSLGPIGPTVSPSRPPSPLPLARRPPCPLPLAWRPPYPLPLARCPPSPLPLADCPHPSVWAMLHPFRPCLAGNTVFFVDQAVVSYYGVDLFDFFDQESVHCHLEELLRRQKSGGGGLSLSEKKPTAGKGESWSPFGHRRGRKGVGHQRGGKTVSHAAICRVHRGGPGPARSDPSGRSGPIPHPYRKGLNQL
ncbi:Transposon TX1 uncharacterized protein [Nymphaea thermarum]|nr:Transposon TX1 uncharacterized protein [Nymphaea thermarum]